MPTINIALGTDDGITLSNRFGQARKVLVVTVEDGREIGRELRDKAFTAHHHGHHDHDEHHHHDGPQDKFVAITDCKVLITRSIGPHGAEHAATLGIQLYTVNETSVEEALRQYLAGTLVHNPRRIA